MKTKTISLFAALAFSICSFIAQAQDSPKPVASPPIKTTGKIISVSYGQPSKKGREIFGKLVPFGEVWRTGANEATEITFEKDVIIEGKPIKKGTYTLFTMPEKDNWTIMLNSVLKQWGAYSYDKEKDVASFKAPAKTATTVQEKFTIAIKETASTATATISWDKTRVDLLFKVK